MNFVHEFMNVIKYFMAVCCVGMGKTTLANMICVKWARDGFLAEDFDVVLLIPLKLAQQRPVEDVVLESIGGVEPYEQLKQSSGSRCLIILEGLDDITTAHQNRDNFLSQVLNSVLWYETVVLVTSRLQACARIIVPHRTVEVVGFGEEEITEFAEKSFSKNETFQILQLKHYCAIG